ncbi:ABC transporter ATP-binding protein [Aeromonas schubertii]|uniref:ABC transporter ATP-binding protein n=1 Tax=Aeromonas schubertii TaxID=652 RepID=A0ABS7VEY1_9GAMM|nr:ABC transporter ATP-binding protein [Aeromonas schubertii]MBZ6067947.1 ABC transporter ATP-binding protein [Aeromonas schubertii]MBZ6074026.1 ABC transporter ATP-binding protein [Aeromonas schubertii]QCG48958.1 ABC transporter ATP-binding protein [Aeromonas schubertii]
MIVASEVELIRGGRKLLDGASATIHPGHKVGLVGKNGCGKSTFFALIRGELTLDAGSCSVPSGWQIAGVAQETPALECSALDYVIDGDREYRALEARLKAAEAADDGMQVAELHGQLDTIGAWSIRARAAELLHGLGFGDEQLASPVRSFSGGWRMRLNLAQALLCRSDLLLLDEPTNHLDLDAVIWLEKWLKSYQGTLILISHDRDFLDAVVGRIIHIENGRLNEYTGGYSDFELQRAEQLAQQQSMFEKQQREIAHMQSYVDRFRYKASKARQAQSRLKAMERMEKILPAHADSEFSFEFRDPAALPTPLIAMENLSAGYGDKVILEKIKLNLVPGSRIGLLGRNGAGKSTFIKMLAGSNAPLSGKLEVSAGVSIGYFAQHQLETLRLDDSPLDHLVRLAPDKPEQELRNYLGSFGFHGDKALDKVAPFSGGEKARLVLALITWQRPNLLLLDEPTNHLDLEMRHALTLALQGFEGAMVVVSHDRHLLRTTTDDFYLVHGGRVEAFDGDLDDYHKWLGEQDKEASARPADAPASANSALARKDQKRREAEFRQATRPLRQKLEKLEASMEKLQGKLGEIESQLADPAIYEESAKGRLSALLKSQGPLKEELEGVELEWMSLSEELETMEQAFAAE